MPPKSVIYLIGASSSQVQAINQYLKPSRFSLPRSASQSMLVANTLWHSYVPAYLLLSSRRLGLGLHLLIETTPIYFPSRHLKKRAACMKHPYFILANLRDPSYQIITFRPFIWTLITSGEKNFIHGGVFLGTEQQQQPPVGIFLLLLLLFPPPTAPRSSISIILQYDLRGYR